MSNMPHRTRGFSLIELMIAIAIIAIVAAIAIPAYNSYMTDARWTVMHLSINNMRSAAEDYRLSNGDYGTDGTVYVDGDITTLNDWEPDDQAGRYVHSLRSYVLAGRPTYDLWVVDPQLGVWYRCDNRMADCCNGEGAVVACP